MENMVGQYQMTPNMSPFQAVSSVPLPVPAQPQVTVPNPVLPAGAAETPVPVSNPCQAVNTTQMPNNNIQVPNYSGVNIQIFNPSVTAPGATAAPSTVNAPNYCPNPPGCYPSNYYTQNFAQSQDSGTKKEKREIIVLTDEYIKNLETYLNSQDAKVRLQGAKEVMTRLQEDPSRKNDAALNALVNKMLQDPYQPVKYVALGLLDTRAATGDGTSVKLLQGIQQDMKKNYGEDSLKATNILLKMSGNTTEKEFEVKDKPKSKSKSKEE